MSDNTQLGVAAGGDSIRTLDKTGTGAPKTEVVALDLGGGDGRSELIASFPIPTRTDSPTDDDDIPFLSLSPATMDAIEMLVRQTIAAVAAPYLVTPAETAALLTPTNLRYPPGDLRRYGALPNSDVTTAWASALLQCQQTGGATVYVPAALGTGCTITAGVVAVAEVEIVGDGYDSSILSTSNDITILSLPNAGSGSKITGVRFLGKGVGATLPGILLTNCNQCTFTGVRVTQFGVGIRFAQGANSCYLNTLINCRIESNNSINIDAQRLTNGLKMIDVTFGGTPVGPNVTAVSQGASAVLTINTSSAVNPFSVNQYVRITGLGGMIQLNGLTPQVTAIGGVSGAWTVTVNHNSTNYTAYTSGGSLIPASTGLKMVDSNLLSISGGDCEGLAYCGIDIDDAGGGTFAFMGHVIQGMDFETSSCLVGDIRIGQTGAVNGVTVIGGYSSATFGDSTNNTIGCNCGINIGPGGCNGLAVLGHALAAGYQGQTEFVTALTQAASAVVTYASTEAVNPFLVGQQLAFVNVQGMTQVNGNSYLISATGGSSGAWTATLGVNSTGFGAFTTGGTVTNNCGYLRLKGTLTNERIQLAGAFAGQLSQYVSQEGKINYTDRPTLSLDAPTFLDAAMTDWTKWTYYKASSNNITANKTYAAHMMGMRLEAGTAVPGAGSILYAARAYASDGYGHNIRGLQVTGAFDQTAVTIAYSSSMTWRASNGNAFLITATNNTAFAIGAPIFPATGQYMTVVITNSSGGALGVLTWNAAFVLNEAWVQPANGFTVSILFLYNGTSWIEQSRGITNGIVASPYAPAMSFVVPTGNFSIMSERLQLTSTQRGTLQGTARLRIT